MQSEFETTVEWLPFELHPGIPPEGKELPGYVRAYSASGADAYLLRLAEDEGLPMVLADRMVNSRRALEASEYAREQGRHEPFHRAVFRKFYGQGEDMYDWAVLSAAAEEVGLDPEEMQARTERGDFRVVVDRAITGAYRLGITGVPAYIFDNKYLIRGVQPYPVFRQTMLELGAASRRDGHQHRN